MNEHEANRYTLEEVVAVEREVIKERRKKAGFTSEELTLASQPEALGQSPADGTAEWTPATTKSATTNEEKSPPEQNDSQPQSANQSWSQENDVGLCLSGGGIRSAAFNLGFLQTLYRSGILRFVDYLSSVSGGSYIGGMFSHAISRSRTFKESRNNNDFYNATDGRQTSKVLRLISNGNYLFRLHLLANRYFVGLLFHLIPRVALLAALGSGVAFLWRALDYNIVRDHLRGLGLESDFAPALLPAFLLGFFWCLSWLGSHLLKSSPLRRCSNVLFFAGIVSLFIGFFVLLGNGDITRTNSDGDESRITFQHNLRYVVAALTAIGLLPILSPRRLLKSGVAPNRLFDSWIFYYFSAALLVGIPLVVIGYFAQEDVSGYGSSRGPDLLIGDAISENEFTEWILEKDMNRKFRIEGVDYILKDDLFTAEGRLKQLAARCAARRTISQYASRVLLGDQFYSASLTPVTPDILMLPISNNVESNQGKPSASNDRSGSDTTSDKAEDQHSIVAKNGSPRSVPAWYTELFVDRNPKTNEENVLLLGELKRIARFERDYDKVVAQSADTPATDDADPSAKQSRRTQFARPNKWTHWKYIASITPYLEFGQYLLFADNGFRFYLDSTREHQSIAVKLFEEFNSKILREKLLFEMVDGERGGTTAEERTVNHDLEELLALWRELGEDDLTDQQIAELNRRMMVAVYPEMIRSRGDIRRTVVHVNDQKHRLICFTIAIVVFLAVSYVNDPNSSSLHQYYSDTLANAFLDEPFDEDEAPRQTLAECQPHLYGAPMPLFGAAFSLSKPWVHPTQLRARFSSFMLSPLFCGSTCTGFRPTSSFVSHPNELTTADTMAISGAALSPNYFVQHIVILLMSILNLRMGKWLPNPKSNPIISTTGGGDGEKNEKRSSVDSIMTKYLRPRQLRIWWQELTRPKVDHSHLLVTDGGHVDNLGLGVLLERRCRLIILTDCSQDPQYEYPDFCRLMRDWRNEHGVEFVELYSETTETETRLVELGRHRPLIPCEKSREDDNNMRRKQLYELFRGAKEGTVNGSAEFSHFFVAEIKYPDQPVGEKSFLVYIKPTLTGDESADVYQYAFNHPVFPHESTSDQAFDAAQFEAYRMLGEHSARKLHHALNKSSNEIWDQTKFDPFWLFSDVLSEVSSVDENPKSATVEEHSRSEAPDEQRQSAPKDKSQSATLEEKSQSASSKDEKLNVTPHVFSRHSSNGDECQVPVEGANRSFADTNDSGNNDTSDNYRELAMTLEILDTIAETKLSTIKACDELMSKINTFRAKVARTEIGSQFSETDREDIVESIDKIVARLQKQKTALKSRKKGRGRKKSKR